MKKDRDCGMQYSMYGQMPMMPMPYQMPYQMNQQTPNYQNVNNDFVAQLNNLEKRVSALETIVNNNPYNNSNYQMM